MASITFVAKYLTPEMHEKILKKLRELEDEILHSEDGFKGTVSIRSG